MLYKIYKYRLISNNNIFIFLSWFYSYNKRPNRFSQDLLSVINFILPYPHYLLYCPSIRQFIQSENTPNQHRYNAPTADEVRIIIVDNHGKNIGHQDIVLKTQSNQLQWISEMHHFYGALQYVLIFPQGMTLS